MGRVLGKHRLLPHPGGPLPPFVLDGKVSEPVVGKLVFEFVAAGEVGRIELPVGSPAKRTDGLWQHTCFEAFLGVAGGGYFELNFAASGQWATYSFDAYREGMADAADVLVESITSERSEQRLAIIATITVPMSIRQSVEALALSAVIEERDGTKSYWALAHPPGAPDFHHPSCFTATLPAPSAP